MLLFSGLQIREDHAFLRQLFIEVNLRMTRRENDLASMLISNERFQQIFPHCGKIIKYIVSCQLELINGQSMNICAAPGLVCGYQEGNVV